MTAFTGYFGPNLTQKECEEAYAQMAKEHSIRITVRIPVDDTHTTLIFEDGVKVTVEHKAPKPSGDLK